MNSYRRDPLGPKGPHLEGTTDEGREYVLSGLRDRRMVFDGRKGLVVGLGRRHLHDLKADPGDSGTSENHKTLPENDLRIECGPNQAGIGVKWGWKNFPRFLINPELSWGDLRIIE